MSKRRGHRVEEREPEALTPEERRAQRRRERTRRKAGHTPSSVGRWRKVAVLAIPAGVIGVIVTVLVISNLPTPCLSFSAVPVSSGIPTFPNHNTTDFSTTWCPSASDAYAISPQLRILINGSAVTLPNSIGRNTSYPKQYECDLPVRTSPPQPPSYPAGSILIVSPWAYRYNLSTFFDIWSQSYPSVFVDQAHPSQPIIYQQGDILGYQANQTFSVTLSVDGHPSSAGPLLDLTTLNHAPNPYPSCLGTLYGTNHTITISYGRTNPVLVRTALGGPSAVRTPGDSTASHLPIHLPLPSSPLSAPGPNEESNGSLSGLDWLVLRVAS